MAVRESFLTVGAQVAAAPGPAHYTPGVEREHMHVKGGNSLKSKVHVHVPVHASLINLYKYPPPPLLSTMYIQAERFQAPKSEVPGPGMYSVSKKSDWLRKTYPPPNENEVSAHVHVHKRSLTHHPSSQGWASRCPLLHTLYMYI